MKINKQEVIRIGEKHLDGINFEFFKRVWSSDLNNYSSRIKALKICNYQNVLDVGCGFGQWSIAMSQCNEKIYSVDISNVRINTLEKIIFSNNITNIKTNRGSIEKMKFKNNFFDCIFSYSSLYFTDFKKTLKEFKRLLKPNGKLYISTNGIGWYLHNLIDGHNSSQNFDSRKMAIETFNNTINYYENNLYTKGKQIIIPSEILKKTLVDLGFDNTRDGMDGSIVLDKSIKSKSFYPPEYHGMEGVYEVLTYKKI